MKVFDIYSFVRNSYFWNDIIYYILYFTHTCTRSTHEKPYTSVLMFIQTSLFCRYRIWWLHFASTSCKYSIRHCLRKANHFTWLTYITEYKLCNQHVSNADTQRELIVTCDVSNAPYNEVNGTKLYLCPCKEVLQNILAVIKHIWIHHEKMVHTESCPWELCLQNSKEWRYHFCSYQKWAVRFVLISLNKVCDRYCKGLYI